MKESNDTSADPISQSHVCSKWVLVLFMFTLVTTPPATAEIYKWFDENGKTHYGSDEPLDAYAEKLNIKIDKTRPIKKKIKPVKKDDKISETIEDDKISRKEKARICKRARAALQNILSRGRIREFNEKGESVILSEEMRQKRISTEKNLVNENCN